MLLPVTIACEGQTDHDAISHVCAKYGLTMGTPYVVNGLAEFDRRMNGFVNASRYAPWIIQRDLDGEACAPTLRDRLVPQVPPLLNFLITVRQTEAWFIADAQGFASFCGVSAALIPTTPETLGDSKSALLAIVRRSRRAALRADMLPLPASGRRTGPAYGLRIREFIQNYWSVERAIEGGAISLAKFLQRIERYRRHQHWQRAG
jgi:hypothetical protein